MPLEPTDIAILLVSLAACAYCVVLSRRLKALRDTKNGLGATIVALSKSINALSKTTQETRDQASHVVTRLTSVMEDANAISARLETMTTASKASYTSMLDKVREAQAELGGFLKTMLDESKQQVSEMSSLVHELRDLAEGDGRRLSFGEDDPHELFSSNKQV